MGLLTSKGSPYFLDQDLSMRTPKFGFILLLVVNTVYGFGQGSPLSKLSAGWERVEKEFGYSLPEDYKNWIINCQSDLKPSKGIACIYEGEEGLDPHYLWSAAKIISKNKALRSKWILTENELAFGHQGENDFLFYRKGPVGWMSKVFSWDEEYGWEYRLFSIAQPHPFTKTETAIQGIETIGFDRQDLSEIEDCPDCLYHYAIALQASPDEDFFSIEQNEKAQSIFRQLAKLEHPKAAAELAFFYQFQDSVLIDEVIRWREKAMAWGSVEDYYELADFIIDYQPEAIEKAIDALHVLLDHTNYKGRAALKLSRLYMRGTGGKLDYEKGIRLVNQSIVTGNLNAIADLGFYYYKGMGVEKDLQKAYDLLLQANQISIEKWGGGMWDEQIELLKKEMKK